MRIRDKRLYRTPEDPKRTFADYCRERFDMGRSIAYSTIDASQVVERLSAIADITPASESQVRPLLIFSSPDPEDTRKRVIDHNEVANVWAEVVERAPRNGNDEPVITAKHVKETVDLWKAADEPYRKEPDFDASAASRFRRSAG